VNTALIPEPLRVLEAGSNWIVNGTFLEDVTVSLWRVFVGLIIGIAIGIGAGLLTGQIKFVEETVAPLFHVLRAFPPVAIIPLIIIWLGIGDAAKIFSIAFAVFFPIWLSTVHGIKHISTNHLKTAKIFSKSFRKTITQVIFPAIVPHLMNGIRIGVAVAFIMAFVSELAGASNGLGYLIAATQITYQVDLMLAGLITLGLLAAVADYGFVWLTQQLFPWVKFHGQ
jgi:ABC-type nitrate/sulfonate/bicarbonate transport system permease component